MKKKVILYTHGLVLSLGGGAEKIFSEMANALTSKGYEVLAVCDSTENGSPFYPINKDVKFINLHHEKFSNDFEKSSHDCHIEDFICKNYWAETYKEHKEIAAKFEKLINREKPDAIICYYMHLFREISYCKNYNIPTIIMMHSEPERFFTFFGTKYFKLNKLALSKADLVTVLMPSFVKQIKKYYSGDVEVIGNPVNLFDIDDIEVIKNDKKKIVCIARLDKFKRQDLLIEAFSLIANDYPEWEVHLYGQAEPKEYLDKAHQIIEKFNLKNQVMYKGIAENVYQVLKSAEIAAMPSDFEGFSISTAEAMNAGLPCVGFEDCSGINELIIHNKTGLLCKKTPQDLAESIKYLIDNENIRKQFGENAKIEVQKYSSEKVWDEWQKTIENTINKPKNTFHSKIVLIKLLLKSVLNLN